jgi:hypothetical protein
VILGELSHHMMNMWFEIVEIAKTISFSEVEDQLI